MSVNTTPAAAVTQEEIQEWYGLQEILKTSKEREMVLRLKIFNSMFNEKTEGTKTVDLAQGWKAKGTFKLNRSIDIAAFDTSKDHLRSLNIPIDLLVTYKPELSVSVYRKLTEEQKAEFDAVLTIKEGSPTLEFVPPKAPKD